MPQIKVTMEKKKEKTIGPNIIIEPDPDYTPKYNASDFPGFKQKEGVDKDFDKTFDEI